MQAPSPASSSQRAAQRMPLPHISASLPSALIVRILTSAEGVDSRTIRPSAPMPSRRSQAHCANDATSFRLTLRRSTITKSLREPCIFVTCISRASKTSPAFPVLHFRPIRAVAKASPAARETMRVDDVRSGAWLVRVTLAAPLSCSTRADIRTPARTQPRWPRRRRFRGARLPQGVRASSIHAVRRAIRASMTLHGTSRKTTAHAKPSLASVRDGSCATVAVGTASAISSARSHAIGIVSGERPCAHRIALFEPTIQKVWGVQHYFAGKTRPQCPIVLRRQTDRTG